MELKLDIQEQFSKKKRELQRQMKKMVLNYPKISVKNLYDDAKQGEDVEIYLPTWEQLSNKFDEKKFFFGILGTVKPDYLSEIIQEAHNKRFSISTEDPKEARNSHK